MSKTNKSRLGKLLSIVRDELCIVPRQKKREIKEVTDALKAQYNIPPRTYDKFLSIAQDHNTSVHESLIAVYPLCSYDEPDRPNYVVLPQASCKVENLSHELGHIVLATTDEAEANLFAREITGSHLKDRLRSAVAAVELARRYAGLELFCARKGFNPDNLIQADLNRLADEGVPDELLEAVRKDYEKHFLPIRARLTSS